MAERVQPVGPQSKTTFITLENSGEKSAPIHRPIATYELSFVYIYILLCHRARLRAGQHLASSLHSVDP